MPHVPIFASEQFKGKSHNGVYGDVLLELDWSVGEIIKALDTSGIRENTLIVFTSDNGPWTMFREFGGIAAPLRGEKSTTWNGGGQVPCIFAWPGRIKPAVSPEFMVNYDVYATLAKITGALVEDGEAIDSLDMSGVLLAAEESRARSMFSIMIDRWPTATAITKFTSLLASAPVIPRRGRMNLRLLKTRPYSLTSE